MEDRKKSYCSIFDHRSSILGLLGVLCVLCVLAVHIAHAAGPPETERTHAAPAATAPAKLQGFVGPSRSARIPARPAPPPLAPPRIVLFVLDRIGLGDLLDLQTHAPHLQEFFRGNAVGLMNFASAGGRTAEGAYSSLSAGMHAASFADGGLGLNAGESYEGGTARDAFLRRTGIRAGPQTILNLGLPAVLKLNQDRATGATVGALGALASRAGPTVALGNPDAPEPGKPPVRMAVMLAMRPSGIVDRGDVSRDLLHADPSAPYGIATDPEKLEAAFVRYAPGASLAVVDLGETTRVEAYREELPESLRPAMRRQALARADVLFDRLMRHIRLDQTHVLVVTPSPPLPQSTIITELAPVAMSGPGRSLLSSATTQGTGLVANIDLAPTLERIWESPFPSPRSQATRAEEPDLLMTGAAFDVARAADPLGYLRKLGGAVTAERLAASGPFIPGVAALEVLLGLGALAAALGEGRGRKGRLPARRLLGRACLCAAVAMPLALVIGGEQMPGSLAALTLLVVGAWAGLTLVFLLLGRFAVPAALLACGLALLGDLFTGGLGLRLSPLSDFPIVGARFHGLANEYTGIAIGALLMGVALLCDALPRPRVPPPGRLLLLALFFGSALAIGLSSLGADAGGWIAAVFAFGAFALVLYGLPLSFRNLTGLLILALSGAWLLAVVDSEGLSPTHMGHSLLLAKQQGAGYLWTIIQRKIALNFRILTDFRAVMVYVGAGALLYLGNRYEGVRLSRAFADHPMLSGGVRAAVTGAVAAWAFNDTGIIPAIFILAAALVAVLATMLESPESRASLPLIQIRLD